MRHGQLSMDKAQTTSVKRILFIDDCEDTNFLHNEYVKMVDKTLYVKAIKQATKVMNYLKETYMNGTFPHLIFVDINLPLMDGFDILEAYRECCFHVKCPDTKVFMLSAVEHIKDKKRVEEFPFVSGHLIKPLNDEILLKILSGNR